MNDPELTPEDLEQIRKEQLQVENLARQQREEEREDRGYQKMILI